MIAFPNFRRKHCSIPLPTPLGALEGDECIEDLIGDVFRNKSVFQGFEVLLEIGGGGEELGKSGDAVVGHRCAVFIAQGGAFVDGDHGDLHDGRELVERVACREGAATIGGCERIGRSGIVGKTGGSHEGVAIGVFALGEPGAYDESDDVFRQHGRIVGGIPGVGGRKRAGWLVCRVNSEILGGLPDFHEAETGFCCKWSRGGVGAEGQVVSTRI